MRQSYIKILYKRKRADPIIARERERDPTLFPPLSSSKRRFHLQRLRMGKWSVRCYDWHIQCPIKVKRIEQRQAYRSYCRTVYGRHLFSSESLLASIPSISIRLILLVLAEPETDETIQRNPAIVMAERNGYRRVPDTQ